MCIGVCIVYTHPKLYSIILFIPLYILHMYIGMSIAFVLQTACISTRIGMHT